MADDIKRAMEALEDVVGRAVEGDSVRPRGFVLMYGRTILAALRERERAIEQARADEREAAVRRAREATPCWGDPSTGPDRCDGETDVWCELHHVMAAAIRARGAR